MLLNFLLALAHHVCECAPAARHCTVGFPFLNVPPVVCP
jgi:hypothetical protein